MMLNDEARQYNRIGVFGLGRFGFGLAIWLAELGADVLAVDSERAKVEEIDQRVSRAICLDATSDFAMAKIDIAALDLAIVAIGRNIQSSLLATAVLQKLGAKSVWTRAIDPSQAEILQAIGVDRIISLEKEMARQVAQNITMPGTRVIAPITVNHSLAEVAARPEFVGKTLAQLDLRKSYGVNVVAIKSRNAVANGPGRERSEVVVNDLPDAADVIKEGDVLVVIGADDHIAGLQTRA